MDVETSCGVRWAKHVTRMDVKVHNPTKFESDNMKGGDYFREVVIGLYGDNIKMDVRDVGLRMCSGFQCWSNNGCCEQQKIKLTDWNIYVLEKLTVA
jgi:hypothetical protein